MMVAMVKVVDYQVVFRWRSFRPVLAVSRLSGIPKHALALQLGDVMSVERRDRLGEESSFPLEVMSKLDLFV